MHYTIILRHVKRNTNVIAANLSQMTQSELNLSLTAPNSLQKEPHLCYVI